MPQMVLPRITSVVAIGPLTLRVEWATGTERDVDVTEIVERFRVFAPLREAPALFAAVRVGDQGTDIIWSDEIDMANDTLWRLAEAQSGNARPAAGARG